MSNTLLYAVKQCISVFLISKYNIDSDFLMSYHDITTCHDIYQYTMAALILYKRWKVGDTGELWSGRLINPR